MKKLIVLAALLIGYFGQSQVYIGYARHGKHTSAEIAAIDVSNTNYIYTAHDTDLGIEVVNNGAGWVPRITGGGSVTGNEVVFNGWDKNEANDAAIDPNSPDPVTFAKGTTAELDLLAPDTNRVEFATDGATASDGFVSGIAVTGTDTKTITLSRNGLPDISTNFTDQGTGGAADGNDYLTTVSETGGIIIFGVQNQTNPTFDLDTFLGTKNYSTGAHTTDTNTQLNETQVDAFVANNGYSMGSHTTDTNTKLTQEQVQDYVGSMVAGNTENGIDVTYDDANDEFDFDVVTTASFTPTLTDAGAGATYTHGTDLASLIKIGKMVFIRLRIVTIATSGTPTANLRITGIPSGWEPNTQYLLNTQIFGSNKPFYSIHAVTTSGQSYIDFKIQDASDGSNISTYSGATISGNGYIYINGTYEID